MAADQVAYLTGESNSPLYSRLLKHLRESRQARASVEQWTATLRALTQKGVKATELDESGALGFLEIAPPKSILTREDLVEEIGKRYYTVKEVLLSEPKFPDYRQPEGEYREYLYIANSERANIEDEVERVEFAMEQLSYDPTPIFEDPGLVGRLEARLEELRSKKNLSIDFPSHHFSDRVTGKHGKNLLAHVRLTIRDGLYFIEEIQSDWAQRGRQDGWKNIPRGPLVTNTEAWSGMVLRRHMQLAAMDPKIKRMAWITESMRNGGPQNREKEAQKHEQAKAYAAFVRTHIDKRMAQVDAKSMTPEVFKVTQEMAASEAKQYAEEKNLRMPSDMLNDFYVALIPKLSQRALGSTSHVSMHQISLGRKVKNYSYMREVVSGDNIVTVPSFEMNDKARDVLAAPQPLYSFAPVALSQISSEDKQIAVMRVIHAAKVMTGSVQHVKFAQYIYDIASCREVAGKYINGVAQVSLSADNIEEVGDHELFHFAQEKLLTDAERNLLERAFARDSELTYKTRLTLRVRGMNEAARQCDNTLEAAAHAFALWRQGHISVKKTPGVESIFTHVSDALRDGIQWLRKTILQEKVTSVEELFQALARGELAERAKLEKERINRLNSEVDESPDEQQLTEDGDSFTSIPRMR